MNKPRMGDRTRVLNWCVVFMAGLLAAPAGIAQDGAMDVTDLSHWTQVGDANWKMEAGVLVADAGNGFVVSPDTHRDLEINLEFWADENSNSGVFIRCQDVADISGNTCYEVNIYDTREDQTGASGAIVRIAPSSQKMITEGRWNTYKIRAEGNHIVVTLNGVETVNIEDDRYTDGPTALQFGQGGLKFRNVMIEKL
jgi:hypothetical protein